MTTIKKFIGSFEFNLTKKPQDGLLYCKDQTVCTYIKQGNQTISTDIVENINEKGTNVKIEFEYINFVDPIELSISQISKDYQFNLDNPVEISNLVIDDLFDCPQFLYKLLKLIDSDNKFIENSNVLYQTGTLVLRLNIPISPLIAINAE